MRVLIDMTEDEWRQSLIDKIMNLDKEIRESVDNEDAHIEVSIRMVVIWAAMDGVLTEVQKQFRDWARVELAKTEEGCQWLETMLIARSMVGPIS